MELEKRFYDVLTHWVHDTVLIGHYWQELSTLYNESHRAYHNLNHLEELFNHFDNYYQELDYPNEVAYAIFYHDIVYDIWSKKNELKSARMAAHYLSINSCEQETIDRVYNLIMATKTHQPSSNIDERWMVDFDIAILGQSQEIYLQYTQQIRQEYQPVPGLIYKKGRRKVLKHFINKARIYHTDIFYDLYEKQARENLNNELKTL